MFSIQLSSLAQPRSSVLLARSSDGTFRRFGYIGYKTEKEAKSAAKYFNNTFLDTSKIAVELARPIGDASMPRPWSKYSAGSSGFQKRAGPAQPSAPQPASEEAKLSNRAEVHTELDRKLRLMSSLYGADAASQLALQSEKLEEYLDVMQPRSQSRTWANDQTAKNEDQKIVGKGGRAKAEVLAVKNKKPGGDGLLVTRSKVTFDDDSEGSDGEYQDFGKAPAEEAEEKDDEEEEQPTLARDAEVSDMDYFRSKMSKNLDLAEEEEDEEADADGEDDEEEEGPLDPEKELERIHAQRSGQFVSPAPIEKPKPASDAMDLLADDEEEAPAPAPAPKPTTGPKLPPPAELAADTGRLFVRNLTYSCTEDDLKQLFSKYGPLAEIHIPVTKDTKKPKGYAFVMFLIPEHAVKAMSALHGGIFQGRIIEVLAGEEKPKPHPEPSEEKSSYKKQLAAKRKETAKSGEAFWNSLFMNSDAIAEAMSKRLGVSKAEVLDPNSDNLAVRLALAETHVIGETKAYLEEEGISLDAFEKEMRKERSNTVILVKNIPASTVEEELEDAFGKFGTLGRVVLPPAKTIALIEFLEPNEAKSAFRHLAFSKFKHLPLYLEWAPMGVFRAGFVKDKKKAKEEEAEVAEEEATAAADGGGEAVSAAGSTLFVKNLNFSTTEDGLRRTFEAIGGLRSVTISTKPDPKHKGARLSMGFGFVEFSRKEDAKQAVKTLQGFVLDGHSLQLKFSNRGANGTEADAAAAATTTKRGGKSGELIEAKGTKLLIRNVPFEATKKDIRQLFAPFGQLKSVRVPKKSQLGSGQHRGFAFVDFLTKQEAKNAFEALSSTHLYGRHVVIEWAEDDASVEALRQKTRKHFQDADDSNVIGQTIGGAKKKNKISMGDSDDSADEEF